MYKKIILLILILFLSSCSTSSLKTDFTDSNTTDINSSNKKKNVEINTSSNQIKPPSTSGTNGTNINQETNQTKKPDKIDTNNTVNISKEKKEEKQVNRILTLYIHGYDQIGYQRDGVFGQDSYDRSIQSIINFSNYSTTSNYKKEGDENIIAIATYYGDKAPSYWDERDLDEYESMEVGIPRYSLIMAKYAKHMLEETNSTKLNIVSVSMGSLIARYMIEKDLEHLASDKIIKKWISFEGVVSGNIGASDKDLVSLAKQKAPEVRQMSYNWIEREFGTLRSSQSPYMRDIDKAFESSTNDHLNNQIITFLTGEANDGVQAVRDTYFRDDDSYPHTYYYQTHMSLSNTTAPWAYAAIFLNSSKRVKITLDEVSLNDLHEDRLFFKSILPAEVVFETYVYSPKAMQKFHFNYPIDERVLKSHYLKIFKYKRKYQSKELGLKIFDSIVLEDEKSLKLKITPYELDNEPFYGVYEFTGHGSHESLGSVEFEVPLESGTYPIQTDEWSGSVSVEVLSD